MGLKDEELTALFDDHAGDLFRYLARRTFDVEVARDLLGETYAAAVASRNKFRGDARTEGRQWLFGIASNVLHGSYRDSKRRRAAMSRFALERRPLHQDDIAELEEFAELDELRSKMKSSIERLPEAQAEVLRMKLVEELDYGEIATRLGIPETAVRARVSRAVKSLRESLADDPSAEDRNQA
ncbi:MAG: sigma-70 family RNA polymerase sigma factor [Solirubrobacterales bacterium]